MSRGGLRPLRSRSRTTARVIASMSFMSTAPRPQTQPSAISPENGWCGPVVGVGRDDVGVPVDQQRGPRRVLALDPGHGGGAALVRLEDLRLEAHLGELLRHVLGGGPLARPRVVAVVAGVDPDQLTAQVDDLVLARDRPLSALPGPARSRCSPRSSPAAATAPDPLLPSSRAAPPAPPRPVRAAHPPTAARDRTRLIFAMVYLVAAALTPW